MSNIRDSVTYHKIKNRLFYLGLFLDVFILVLIQVTKLSVFLRDFSAAYFSNAWCVNGLYLFIFCGTFYIIHSPLRFFAGYIWEHRFGLSTQNFYSWLIDDIKKALLSFVFIVVIVEVIYMLLAKFPQGWWIGAGISWLFLSLLVARIMPNIIIPLFYKYSKIENGDLREGIVQLFNKCKVPIQDVYSINLSSKTKKANAFVCGLGRKRRVVLTDNLLQNFSKEEINAVVAHELGHYKNKDIVKLIAVNAAVIFLGFYLVNYFLGISISYFGLLGLGDIAALPLFAFVMMVFSLLTAPVLNAFSRFLENKADIFSLKVTDGAKDFISMMKKLADMNLSELEPSKFNVLMFYDHPPILKRIHLAEQFQSTNA